MNFNKFQKAQNSLVRPLVQENSGEENAPHKFPWEGCGCRGCHPIRIVICGLVTSGPIGEKGERDE